MSPIEYAGSITPGNYYTGMPNRDYHAAEGISKSGLDLINRSPAHYAHRTSNKPTRAMEIGTAIHTALLEPDLFRLNYMLLTDTKDRRSAAYKDVAKFYGGDYVLTGPESDKVIGMQESVYANPHARALLESEGYCELSGVVKDPETGIICRHRFDKLCIQDGWALDVKKTQDARYDAFQRTIYNYRYHVQAAFYLDQYEWITGERLKGFKFLAIEEEMPHGVGVYYLDDGSLAIAREEYQRNLQDYAECINTNHWPCYESEPQIMTLPGWVLAQYENELEDGGII